MGLRGCLGYLALDKDNPLRKYMPNNNNARQNLNDLYRRYLGYQQPDPAAIWGQINQAVRVGDVLNMPPIAENKVSRLPKFSKEVRSVLNAEEIIMPLEYLWQDNLLDSLDTVRELDGIRPFKFKVLRIKPCTEEVYGGLYYDIEIEYRNPKDKLVSIRLTAVNLSHLARVKRKAKNLYIEWLSRLCYTSDETSSEYSKELKFRLRQALSKLHELVTNEGLVLEDIPAEAEDWRDDVLNALTWVGNNIPDYAHWLEDVHHRKVELFPPIKKSKKVNLEMTEVPFGVVPMRGVWVAGAPVPQPPPAHVEFVEVPRDEYPF